MSKDARNEDVTLSPVAKKLFDELVKVAAIERFGQEPRWKPRSPRSRNTDTS